jgi:hypothetical protein
MSRQLKNLMTSFLFLLISQASFASQDRLEQIQLDISDTLTQLLQNPMSNSHRLQLITQNKSEAESQIRDLIMNNMANPSDLSNPKSALSRAFRAIDGLTILSEVQLVAGTEIASRASCGRALSMLTISSTSPQSDTIDFSALDQSARRLLTLLCKTN